MPSIRPMSSFVLVFLFDSSIKSIASCHNHPSTAAEQPHAASRQLGTVIQQHWVLLCVLKCDILSTLSIVLCAPFKHTALLNSVKRCLLSLTELEERLTLFINCSCFPLGHFRVHPVTFFSVRSSWLTLPGSWPLSVALRSVINWYRKLMFWSKYRTTFLLVPAFRCKDFTAHSDLSVCGHTTRLAVQGKQPL